MFSHTTVSMGRCGSAAADNRIRRRFRGLGIAVVALATLFPPAAATADDSTGNDSRADVWLISTRRAARCGQVDFAAEKIDFHQLGDDHRWQPADLDSFLRSDDPDVPTAVFVHGNRAGANAAIRDGEQVLRRMKRHAGQRSFRLAIWSWPSDRIAGRQRHDVRIKAAYSDVQAYYLAECLHRIEPEVSVGLVGYSFGARVITGALHMLGGGTVAGRGLSEEGFSEEQDAGRTPLRAMLVAAACDAGWLLPGHRHGLATSRVERIMVTRNGCDPVLRWYPRLYGRRGPQAMGYAGAYCCGDSRERIEQLGVSCSVGRNHDWNCYVRAPAIERQLAWYTFLNAP